MTAARAMRRPARMLALAAVLGAGSSPAAFAHGQLAGASPASDARLAQAPAQVVLHFSEPLEAAFSTIEVTDAQGRTVSQGRAEPGASPRELRVRLEPLPAGRYTVNWKALSVDTHSTSGRYGFTVAGP